MGRGMQKVNELVIVVLEIFTYGELNNPLPNSLPLNKRRRRKFFKPKMFFTGFWKIFLNNLVKLHPPPWLSDFGNSRGVILTWSARKIENPILRLFSVEFQSPTFDNEILFRQKKTFDTPIWPFFLSNFNCPYVNQVFIFRAGTPRAGTEGSFQPTMIISKKII